MSFSSDHTHKTHQAHDDDPPLNRIPFPYDIIEMFDSGEYSYAYSPTSDGVFSDGYKKSKKGKGNNNNKRRFSDEQIKCLETMFESEARLEPGKKLKLASELGLQPRQVAIWFQNKRARWKSKQLERDYSLLLANYNALASRFEALNKDKQALLLQLKKLEGDTAMKREEDDRSSEEKCDEKKAVESFGVDDEAGVVIAAEPAESSLTSPDDYWDGLDSKALFNDSSNGYEQWWDFWS